MQLAAEHRRRWLISLGDKESWAAAAVAGNFDKNKISSIDTRDSRDILICLADIETYTFENAGAAPAAELFDK